MNCRQRFFVARESLAVLFAALGGATGNSWPPIVGREARSSVKIVLAAPAKIIGLPCCVTGKRVVVLAALSLGPFHPLRLHRRIPLIVRLDGAHRFVDRRRCAFGG